MKSKNYCILELMTTKTRYYLISADKNFLNLENINDGSTGQVHAVNKSLWIVVECKNLKSDLCNNFLCIKLKHQDLP